MGFLLIYLTIYGGMNACLWWHIWRVLPPHSGLRLAWSAWVFFMVLCPLLLGESGERLHEVASRYLAWLLFTWMAWCFWFDVAALACAGWNGFSRSLGGALQMGLVPFSIPSGFPLALSPRTVVTVALTWVAAASLIGWFEAGRIQLRTVDLPTPKLPAGTRPIRLCMISDLHIGRTMRPGVIQRVLDRIVEADADVLVSAGDLVDAHESRGYGLMRQFAKIRPGLGKYAVVGNHEVYPGLEESIALHEEGGFTVLRGTHAEAGTHLRLVGVDDPAVGRRREEPSFNEDVILTAAASTDRFVVLLRHQPSVRPAAMESVDLQLSGHVHGGQIFPFGWFVRLVYAVNPGRLHELPHGLRFYVSAGAGTWGPPFRLGATPEITVFRILPAVPAAAAGS